MSDPRPDSRDKPASVNSAGVNLCASRCRVLATVPRPDANATQNQEHEDEDLFLLFHAAVLK